MPIAIAETNNVQVPIAHDRFHVKAFHRRVQFQQYAGIHIFGYEDRREVIDFRGGFCRKSSDLFFYIINHSVVPSQQASFGNCYSGNTVGSLHVAVCYKYIFQGSLLLQQPKFPPRVAIKYTSSSYAILEQGVLCRLL
jgi:hypothetical protein